MAIPRTIPIEHAPALHQIATEAPEATDAVPPLTLLELIQAVDEISESEAELVATVEYMMASGRLRWRTPTAS